MKSEIERERSEEREAKNCAESKKCLKIRCSFHSTEVYDKPFGRNTRGIASRYERLPLVLVHFTEDGESRFQEVVYVAIFITSLLNIIHRKANKHCRKYVYDYVSMYKIC